MSRARRGAGVMLLCIGTLLFCAGAWVPMKAALAQQLLNRAWSETRDDQRMVRPWPWADTWPIARLRLPGGAPPLTVLAGASGRNLAFGPALLDGTALPGRPGVSVIAGHRDTHFKNLGRLAVGDRIEVERPDGGIHAYEVAAVDVVDSEREVLRLDAPEPVLTLVTCYPFDALASGGPLRYVVTAYAARRSW